jgi:hypothetical protein
MTSNQREPDKTMNAAAEAAQKAREATMASMVQLVDNEAAKNGGRVPYGFIAGVVKEFKSMRPNLTRDMINHYRKNRKQSASASDLTGMDGNAAEARSTTTPTRMSNDLPP